MLKDESGRVVCPVLYVYTCPICKATGEDAHTVKHCPRNEGEALIWFLKIQKSFKKSPFFAENLEKQRRLNIEWAKLKSSKSELPKSRSTSGYSSGSDEDRKILESPKDFEEAPKIEGDFQAFFQNFIEEEAKPKHEIWKDFSAIEFIFRELGKIIFYKEVFVDNIFQLLEMQILMDSETPEI